MKFYEVKIPVLPPIWIYIEKHLGLLSIELHTPINTYAVLFRRWKMPYFIKLFPLRSKENAKK